MSSDAISWAFDQELPSTPKFILVAIADHANPAGVCFPGQDRLGGMTGFEASTMVRALKQLERDGFIARTERRRKDGLRTSDWIVLAPFKSEDERRPLKPPAEQEHYPDAVLALFGADNASHGSAPGDSSGPLQGESPGSDSEPHLDLRHPIKGEEPPEGEPKEGTQRLGQLDFRTRSPQRVHQRGRRRQAPSEQPPVEQLAAATDADSLKFGNVIAQVQRVVDESTFRIWIAPLTLAGTDTAGALVAVVRADRVRWIADRFGRVLESAADLVGVQVRVVATAAVEIVQEAA